MNLKTMETPEWVEYYADFTVFNLHKMLRNASEFTRKGVRKIVQGKFLKA